MSGDDPSLLVVPGSVAGQLQDLGGQVLHHGSQVDWSSGSHTLGIVSLAEKSVNATNWELETSSARPRLGLYLGFATFASSRHGQIAF